MGTVASYVSYGKKAGGFGKMTNMARIMIRSSYLNDRITTTGQLSMRISEHGEVSSE